MKDKLKCFDKPIKKAPSISHGTCWICKDQGMIFYKKTINNISYDFAYRCNCKLGQISSNKIPLVPKELAEKIAIKNYSLFNKFT